MARRVFFSFDFEHDVFRANQVRNTNVVGVEKAGYYDHSEYEEAKKKGELAIKRMILARLENTSVTVVLIGTCTASRPWVQFEIKESIARRNGLLGIRIHHLLAPDAWGQWQASLPGPTPGVLPAVAFPVYSWDSDLDRFRREIEAAGQRADKLRAATAEHQRRALFAQPPPRPPWRLSDIPVSPPVPSARDAIWEAFKRIEEQERLRRIVDDLFKGRK